MFMVIISKAKFRVELFQVMPRLHSWHHAFLVIVPNLSPAITGPRLPTSPAYLTWLPKALQYPTATVPSRKLPELVASSPSSTSFPSLATIQPFLGDLMMW